MTISEFFEKDHDEIDAILETVDYKNTAAGLAALREFDRRLERHIVWEEEILFPAAGRAHPMLGQGPIPVMLMEHVSIRAAKAKALERLAQGDGAGARASVEQMLAVLTGHNMKEEHMLYPACDRMIPEAEAASILERLGKS